MTFVQDWPPASNANAATSKFQIGPATTAGNTLFADVLIRQSDPEPIITVTDDGDNDWELITTFESGSAYLALFRADNAAPATQVTASWVGPDLLPFSVACYVMVSEWTPVGLLRDIEQAVVQDGGMPALVGAESGDLVRAVGFLNASNRLWTSVESGPVDAIARGEFGGQQLHIMRQDSYAASSGLVGMGWTLASGTSIPLGISNLVFMETGAPPVIDNMATVESVVTATGWTPSSGSVLDALRDGSGATYITSSESPTNLPLSVEMEPVLAPGAGMGCRVYLRGVRLSAGATDGEVTVALYNGATLRATATPRAITTTPTDIPVDFAPAAVASVQWDSVRVVATFTATG